MLKVAHGFPGGDIILWISSAVMFFTAVGIFATLKWVFRKIWRKE